MKKRSATLILAGLFFFVCTLHAQVDTLWTRTFGGEGWDYGQEVQQTIDGGYIVVGTTGADYLHDSDILLIKTNNAGQTEWTKTIGRSHKYGSDSGRSVQQTTDGGYIITGHSTLPEENHRSQVYLVRTNASGDTLWTRTFGDSLSEEGYSVRQTSDGGFVIAGWTDSYGSGGSDLFLVKTDSTGASEWMSTFGGMFDDAAYSVRQSSDGGYIATGYTRSSSGDDNADVYIVKTSPSGVVEWEKTYGGARDDVGYSVLRASGGGSLVAGVTASYGMGGEDVYLLKTGEDGDTVWTRTFGGNGDDVGSSLDETEDGGIVIAGGTNSFGSGDDVYVIRTDPSGDEVWSWVFGGSLDEFGNCVRATSDGGYVITGDIGSRSGEFWDAYLIRTNPDQVFAGDEPSRVQPLPESMVLQQNYPNPFNPSTTIAFEIPDGAGTSQGVTAGGDPHVNLSVYDLRGRCVRILVDSDLHSGSHRVVWNGRDSSGGRIPTGIYLYTLRAGERKSVRKLTIVK